MSKHRFLALFFTIALGTIMGGLFGAVSEVTAAIRETSGQLTNPEFLFIAGIGLLLGSSKALAVTVMGATVAEALLTWPITGHILTGIGAALMCLWPIWHNELALSTIGAALFASGLACHFAHHVLRIDAD